MRRPSISPVKLKIQCSLAWFDNDLRFYKKTNYWNLVEEIEREANTLGNVATFVQFCCTIVSDSGKYLGHLTFTSTVPKGDIWQELKLGFMIHSLQYITSPLQMKSSQGELHFTVFPRFSMNSEHGPPAVASNDAWKIFLFHSVEQKTCWL